MDALPTLSYLPSSHQKSFISPAYISKNPTTTTTSAAAATTTTTILRALFWNQNSSTSRARKSKQRSSLATIFTALDDFIIKFIDPPLWSSIDPNHVLSGNFAPVGELSPTECEVVYGTLPSCLDGAYIRNGPNPQHLPRGPYHLFDGDGMLHSVRISKGRAILCSRHVVTYKYTVEKRIGSQVIPNVFSGFNSFAASMARVTVTAGRIMTGQFNPSNGIGVANTSLALIGGKLFALGESDLPYAINVWPNGELTTIGRYNFDGKLRKSMTAHPKVDPDTGEVFAFRFTPLAFRPFLTFFRFDKSGSKQPDVPIYSMKSPSFVHDLAITKRYVIFAENQIRMNPMLMIRGRPPVGTDLTKVPRLGVIPRYAEDESEMRWFDVSGFNMLHAINAWDEDGGDTVVMVAPNIQLIEHTLERMDLIHSSMEIIKINLKTGIVSRHPVSTRNLEFGVINPSYVGKKSRFVYAGIGDPLPKISGIVKLDLSIGDGERQECIVASRVFGPGCYGGEPFFIARDQLGDHLSTDAEEDDGFVVSFVHDENIGESRFVVMDAKSHDLEVIAAVKLPGRVPYGFHGLFVKESDLSKL